MTGLIPPTSPAASNVNNAGKETQTGLSMSTPVGPTGGPETPAVIVTPFNSVIISTSIITTNDQGRPVKEPAIGCTGARLSITIVQQEMAIGLHLTVDEVKALVNSGKNIQGIASNQGLSEDQLQGLELNSLQVANERWLKAGCITAQDVTENMRRDSGAREYMNVEFTDWFKN